MDDRELIREIHRGQKQYLNTIAEKYYDDIYRFCCYQTGSRQDSYDLAQETFFRFIRYVDNYRYQNLKGYLLTIARNVCIDYFRTDAMQKKRETELSLEAAQQQTVEDDESLVTVAQLAGQMQREAIILYFHYGLKYREIAKITGVSVSTVKSRVRQGLIKLKNLVRKEDYFE